MLYGGSIINELLDLVFPPRCLLCRSRLSPWGKGAGICRDCISRVETVGFFCPRCGFLSRESSRCYCSKMQKLFLFGVFWYQGFWRKSVHRFKYYHRPYLATSLGRSMAYFLSGFPAFPLSQIEMVTFVPLHGEKEKERGYNQSFLLARELAEAWSLPLQSTLKRCRPTSPQTSLGRGERRRNLHGAFMSENENNFRDKHVLIIDDVITTGATMEEASRRLIADGARKTTGAALAVQRLFY